MDLIKKHYEKILLGLVLLGLTVAGAVLPFVITGKRAKLDEIRTGLLTPKVKELPPLDMTNEEAAIQRVQSPIQVDFSTRHNLLNPVRWMKQPDGKLIKIQTGKEMGAGALEVTAITPLYLILTYGTPSANGYMIGVERQAATNPGQRGKHDSFLTKDAKNDLFSLREIKGPPEKPAELVLELTESGQTASIGPDKPPFMRVEGYQADLKYPQEGRTWHGGRSGMKLEFANEQYNIVAITQTNVIIKEKSNDKKWTISLNPAPETR